MKSRQELISFLEKNVKTGVSVSGGNVICHVTDLDISMLEKTLKQLNLSCEDVGISITPPINRKGLVIVYEQFKNFKEKNSSNNNNENVNLPLEKKPASNINELISFLDEQIKSKKIIAGSILMLNYDEYSYLILSLKELKFTLTDVGISMMTETMDLRRYTVIIDSLKFKTFREKHTTSNVSPEITSANNVQFPPSFFSSNVITNAMQSTPFMSQPIFTPYYYPTGVTQNSGYAPVPVYYYPPLSTQIQTDNNPNYDFSNLTLPVYEPSPSSQQSESQDHTQTSTSSSYVLDILSEPSRKRKHEEETEPSNDNTAEIADTENDEKIFEDLLNGTKVALPSYLIEGINQEFPETDQHTKLVENAPETSSERKEDVAVSTFYGALLAHSDDPEEDDDYVLKFLNIPSSPYKP